MKKKLRIVLIAGAVGIAWIGGCVAALVYFAYNLAAVQNEVSEVLWPMKTKLEWFVARHSDVPESLEAFRRFVERPYLEKGLPVPSFESYECSAVEKPSAPSLTPRKAFLDRQRGAHDGLRG